MIERIKQIRRYFGLSQAQFAQMIDKSPGLISVAERGKCKLSENTCQAICDTFGIEFDWLVRGEGPMFQRGKEKNKVDREGVGVRIRQVRKAINLSQMEFAQLIGCSRMQIYFAERGRNIPSNSFLKKVAKNCHVSYEWLITGKGEPDDFRAIKLDRQLLEWLEKHPQVVKDLMKISGLEEQE